MNNGFLVLVGCVGLLGACANEVIIEDPQQSLSGGNQGSSSSSGSSSSGSSSSGGTTAMCVPNEQPPTGVQPTCQDLDRLVLGTSSITGDTDGDGVVEAGETATLTVMMQDISGLGFNWYPGVEFSTKNALVGVQSDTWYYAILPCGELAATGTIKVAPDAAPGTVVTIRAQIAMLNQKCPEAFAIDVPVKVQ